MKYVEVKIYTKECTVCTTWKVAANQGSKTISGYLVGNTLGVILVGVLAPESSDTSGRALVVLAAASTHSQDIVTAKGTIITHCS